MYAHIKVIIRNKSNKRQSTNCRGFLLLLVFLVLNTNMSISSESLTKPVLGYYVPECIRSASRTELLVLARHSVIGGGKLTFTLINLHTV